MVPAEELRFIVDEVLAGGQAAQIVKHKYGCRIMQRLLERCSREQVKDVLEIVFADVASFCKHPYGNYVVQNILEKGACDDRHRMLIEILDCAVDLCTTPTGCVVVSSAFGALQRPGQQDLAAKLLEEPELLVTLSCMKQGASLVARIMDALPDLDRKRAVAMLSAEAEAIAASRHGRTVLQDLGIGHTAPGKEL